MNDLYRPQRRSELYPRQQESYTTSKIKKPQDYYYMMLKSWQEWLEQTELIQYSGKKELNISV